MSATLVAMAAGMGSRFGGLKQTTKFGDAKKTILDFAIEDAIRAGIDKLVFVIRKAIENDFRESVSKKYESIIDVRYVFQDERGPKLPEGRTKPWGTGHAVLSCAKEISEPFLAINSDDYYGRDVYLQAVKFLSDSKPSRHALAGYKLKNTLSQSGGVSRGICRSNPQSGELLSIKEYSGLKMERESPMKIVGDESCEFSGDELTSLNFWAFEPDFMQLLGAYFDDFISLNSNDTKSEFYLPSAVDRAIKEEKANVIVLPTDEVWQGVTYKEDAPRVEEFLRRIGRI